MRMITVRVPETLHGELLDEAKREGVSLNQLCLTKLARPLNWYRQKDQDETWSGEHEGQKKSESNMQTDGGGRRKRRTVSPSHREK